MKERNPDKKFLKRYFRSIYNKLEADALLFNRKLPHASLAGSENEQALADVIRDFLPTRYGVEVNALVIDRHGQCSRQSDIVIYDGQKAPRYFRKVYPIELVIAVVEVKTQLNAQVVQSALENESSLRSLDFFPQLAPYWQTRTKEENIPHAPPVHCIFGYRSDTTDFATFASWFRGLPSSTPFRDAIPYHPPFNHFISCSLDKGLIFSRGVGIHRWVAVADQKDDEKYFPAVVDTHPLLVDPAKSLFLFLEVLWTMLEQSPRHPGFDIRTYMDEDLGSLIDVDHEGKIKPQ